LFKIGDKIRVLVELFDSYGKRKTIGGDHLRARIWNVEFSLSAPGTVFDNTNGSYMIIFECFWGGPSQISVSIAYTREGVSALFRLMTRVGIHHSSYLNIHLKKK
jgi:hypothetical protein